MVLEKRAPEPLVNDVRGPAPTVLPFVRLEKLLLATALVEAGRGSAIETERALEASWSLGRAFATGKVTRMLGAITEDAYVYREIALPSFLSPVRRAARLMLDRELTLKVFELRFEKAASRDGAWPTDFENLGSSVCPGVAYAYRSDGKSMEIRFDGPVNTPEAGVVPSLDFRSGGGPCGSVTHSHSDSDSPTPAPEPEDLDSSSSPGP